MDAVETDAKENWYSPSGWAIKAYKHMNVPSSDFQATNRFFNEITQGRKETIGRERTIAYGNFDRIQLQPIRSFSEFSDVSNLHNWFGSSQAILLYSWKDKQGDRVFEWEPEKERFRAVRKMVRDDGTAFVEEQKGSFFAISFCYISDWVRNTSANHSFGEMLNECNSRILKYVEQFNKFLKAENNQNAANGEKCHHEPVLAEVFGSLSTAELVILWSAKQYTDILYLIDSIRDLRWVRNSVSYDENQTTEASADSEHGVFRTTYTMVSFPELIAPDEDESIRERVRDILGQAYIQFATQDTAGETSFIKFKEYMERCLKNASKFIKDGEEHNLSVKLRRSAGEYDLIAGVKSKYLPPLFCYPTSMRGIDEPIPAGDEEDFTFNVHHPGFNRFILYSTTRLTYELDDLPDFARGDGKTEQRWKDSLKSKMRLIGGAGGGDVWKRSERIKRIEEERKEKFQEMMQTIRQHIPAVSNLSKELNQLFSDYIQCCCSSADYLWIDDFDELFQQTMERVTQSVKDIAIYDEGELDKDAWDRARRTTESLSNLIRALHRQISHISTSNKLFFREQETHFGYTAQHDLVIHAFYDIIKHLIEFIYSYRDRKRQSVLYPLVNFQAENRIVSEIFTEESEEFFLKHNLPEIRPRIMVIRIPLDGVDNLMYYLPMLVHEVYHYASPKDRDIRNRYLAKVVIYQTLRYNFTSAFVDLVRQIAVRDGYEKREINDIQGKLEIDFDKLLSPVFFRFINEKEEKIQKGLKEYYFQGVEPAEKRAKFMNHSILRRWFTNWLEQWLSDERKGKGKKAKDSDQKYENFSDLYLDLFPLIIKTIGSETEKWKDENISGDERVWRRSIKDYGSELESVLQLSGMAEASNDENLLQSIARYTNQFVEDDEYGELLRQMDEILPDMAMVTMVGMPASGYMLQIALDLDKQFVGGRESQTDYIRFGAVLCWMLKQQWIRKRADKPETADESESTDIDKEQEYWKEIDDLLKAEQEVFRTLYCSSYQLAMRKHTEREDELIRRRADNWCDTFQSMLDEYTGGFGFHSCREARSWIDYIVEQMVESSLKFKDDELEKNRLDLFETPYHQYLNILQHLESGGEKEQSKHQVTLFELSIQTILKFQRHKTLSQLSALLQPERPENSEIDVDFNPDVNSHPRFQDPYIARIPSMDQYEHTIQMALDRLYRYREADGLPEATGMWYRGVSHAEYPVLPSGFVHFGEDVGMLNKGMKRRDGSSFSFLELVLHHYEAFRYAAEGSSNDISPSQYYNTFNYLTLMQHYRQHTNLLDWSEDFFASTYFALEDEINLNDRYEHEQKEGQRDRYLRERKADAALYILDPVRFNVACREIEEEENSLFSENPFEPNLVRTSIPNLSIDENKEPFKEYYDLYSISREKLQGVLSVTADPVPTVPNGEEQQDISLKHLREHCFSSDGETGKGSIKFHLPRAVYAAKLNSRIRAQSGLFVAFSLKSAPAVWNDSAINTNGVTAGLFNYQSLERIQDYYMDVMGKKPFLMKIVIPASMKLRLGELYYELGLSKERIYPEMDNQRNR